MNRIDHAFENLQIQGRKGLIPFLTAGDPDLATTEALVKEMVAAGADLIEIGIPFSDPVAEGPVIQEASERGLASFTTLAKVFPLVKSLRESLKIPILLMLYANSVFAYGPERFFTACEQSGIDGIIVPDLPFEERDELAPFAREKGVYLINLVAPTSEKRIETIAPNSEGFLYCVSSLGVTGAREQFETDFSSFLGTVREHTKVPAALGFGISTASQAAMLAKYADAVIIGSAVVRIIAEQGTKSVKAVGAFLRQVREAIDQ